MNEELRNGTLEMHLPTPMLVEKVEIGNCVCLMCISLVKYGIL